VGLFLGSGVSPLTFPGCPECGRGGVSLSVRLAIGEHEPEGVDHTWDSAEERQDEIDPEMGGKSHLQESRNRGKKQGKNNFDDEHATQFSIVGVEDVFTVMDHPRGVQFFSSV